MLRLTCCGETQVSHIEGLCGESSSKMAPATPGIPGQAPEVPSRHNAERRETLPTARDSHKIPQTRAAPATPDEFQATEEQK